jgi:hypothetical protein
MKTILTDSAYAGFPIAYATESTTTSIAESATSIVEDQVDHSKTQSQSAEV